MLVKQLSVKTESVGSFPVSIHVSVQFPGADTLVTTKIAGDILGSIFGNNNSSGAGDDGLGRVGERIVHSVSSSQVRLQVTSQLSIG